MVRAFGFSQSSAGWIATLPWLVGASTVLRSGWISQVLVARGVKSRTARGVLGCVPMIVGGLLVLAVPYVPRPAAKIALLVLGGGLTGPIYVMCAPMIAEFTPIAQRGAVIAIFGRDLHPGWNYCPYVVAA